MLKAAGLMIVCGPTGKVLFVQRSSEGDAAGTWAFPGGKIEEGETAEEAALRETEEEIGSQPFDNPRPWTRRQKDDVDYETFLARSEVEFTPTLNGEHVAWTWAPVASPPEPLHPGCRIALERLTADELTIARAMVDGELVSPQRYKNLFLVALRITGTGAAYRGAVHDEAGKMVREEEFCWRDPSIYLNADFLARCNGLTVIWDHPIGKPMLNGAEFVKRAIGSVMLPYLKNDEVWAIAKVFDEKAAEMLETEQFSTSPGVVFNDAAPVEMEDGARLLIEDRPALLDHIAVCSAGVWDKGGEPSGIQNDLISNMDIQSQESFGMAENDMAEADKARVDTDAKLDAIMDSLKKAHERMDAMEHERDDRARKDAADDKNADDKRDDAESEEEHREEAENEPRAKSGRFDKSARKDAETEEEKRALEKANAVREREDRARGDEDKPEMKRKAEEAEKMLERADKSRHDALVAENSAMKSRLEQLEARLKPVSAEDRDALARAQMRADSIAGLFGQRASPPIAGETPVEYRRRLAGDFKQHSAMFKDKALSGFDSDVLGFAEERIYADAAAAARAPGRASGGTLIPIRSVDEAGRTITSWTGDNGAWMSVFMTPGRVGRIPDPRNRNAA